ncbi:hypothetical protein [Candidatus Borrarchaeum sp.]|uniref:hypothetical protein n=1 Tax=Candidatus Borrarchaeum sp. TaxID=2846742 RepID=UPI00257A7AA6|nr:hypothetical protein [Candidatus Borrarchaeum sp.]
MKERPLLKGTNICICIHFDVDDESYNKIIEAYKTIFPEEKDHLEENLVRKFLKFNIMPPILKGLEDEKIRANFALQIYPSKDRFARIMTDKMSSNTLNSGVKYHDFGKLENILDEKASVFYKMEWEINTDENGNVFYEYENKKETPFEDYRRYSELWLKHQEKFHGSCCAKLILNAKNVKLVGGLKFPQKLILPDVIINKFGESTLTGIKIGFEDSPLGVRSIKIERADDELILDIKTDFETDSPQNILREVYETIVDIGKLMVGVP